MNSSVVRSGVLLMVLPILGLLYMLTKIGPNPVNIAYVGLGAVFVVVPVILGGKLINSQIDKD